MPIHLLLPQLRRAAAVLLLSPLAALAQDRPLPDGLYAQITTPRGVITCQLEFEKAPLTVTSFVGLAEGTLGPARRKPFFDGLTFHRVVPGFVIQGGDPLGTGEGDPGYTFPDEFGPGLSNDSAGVLSMANDGPDTNGSQFFITLAPEARLDFLYSNFGHVIHGVNVPAKITVGDTMRVKIIRVGAGAKAFKADDAAFEALSRAAKKYGSEKAPGPRAHFDDPDKVLPTSPPSGLLYLYKLNNVERATGVRIFARVYGRFTAKPGAATPDAFAEALAHSLDLGDDTVLAVYFADSETWSLRIGKSLAARFNGTPGHPSEPANEAALDASKKAFLTDSRKRADALAGEAGSNLPKFLMDQGQRSRIIVTAVLTGLILKVIP